MCRQTVAPLNTCKNAKHVSFFLFFLSSNSLDIAFFVQHTCQNPTESLVLQACPCSPDGRHFPGIYTCLFISVKVRVPQRTVASCCILALFHRDMEDGYSLDRLAVTPVLFSCLQVLQKTKSLI
ncbi:hypothetical protein AMECASPLE_000477 [Ameca splendens]|uniref:Uncharacterized protein n=1 Tax=Ameca splendens TaxID=208324 RepID=A0ABV1A430_9TELE